MSVLIGLSAGETSRYTLANASIMNLDRPHGSQFQVVIGLSVPQNLNALAEIFLRSSHDALFLLNDDQLYHPETLIRLLAHQVPVVTGLTVGRHAPFVPAIYGARGANGHPQPIYLEPGMQGLIPIHYCGDHSLLIQRRVIEAMDVPRWAAHSHNWPSPDAIQHDVIFCDGVRAAGFEILCDLDTSVGHLATIPVVPTRHADGSWTTALQVNPAQSLHVQAAAPEPVHA